MNDPSHAYSTVRVRLVKRKSGGLGVSFGPHNEGGLVVTEVIKGGEAERTGYLRIGDIILQVNDRDLSSLPYDQCLRVLQDLTPEEMVTVLVRGAKGYTTYLHTTFNDKGVPHTIRICEAIDPQKKSRKESSPVSPRRSPALTRVRTTEGFELGGICSQNQTNEKNTQLKKNTGASTTTNSSPKFERKISAQGSAVTAKSTSPDRPKSLCASNKDSRKSSISSPSRRPVRLRNITTGSECVESLVLNSTEPIQCCPTVCMGSLMSGPPRRHTTSPRPKEEVLHHAKQFFDQYFSNIKRFSTTSHTRRWQEVVSEVESTGTYALKETELVYGAKLAWRNAPRCIGRIQWSKLQVFDARFVTTSREMFEAICNHIKYATNKGNIRSAVTIFPQRTDGLHDFRVWNPQLIMYAGYRKEDGTIVGDPANVDFTELCTKLGWKGAGKKWDVLPLVLSANGRDPQVFDIPEELILRVPIVHPKYEWFAELGLQWYALPAVSSLLFDVGGIEFPGAPFNGWYMVTEIGSRDLCDSHRFNIVEEVAKRLGVDTRAPSTLWKDRAVVEVNYAVLHSFQRANVTIVDHHTASESFMKHWENEMRLRGGCPADWVWIVPPMSSSLTQVFHQEMLYYNLKPSYEYQDPPCKTHIWEKDRENSGNGPKTPSRKLRFKEVARAAKLTAHLFGMALSRRIKATVLYATETGKSENYGKTLGEMFSHAFNVNVICMADYDIINLEHEALLLVVTSTFGNGDPPENGEAFARSLQAIKVTGDTTPDVEYISNTSMPFVRMNSMPLDFVDEEPLSSPTATLDADIGPLSNVRFSVFALGSSAYPNFCSFGRYVDTLLGELGGERLIKIGTGDELCGQEYSFSQWAQEVFQVACDVFCVGEDVNISDVKASLHMDTSWSPEKVRLVATNKPTNICDGLVRGTSRKVVPCVIHSRKVLRSEEDEKETLFVELTPVENHTLKYLPGDHVGIYPANRKELVDGILQRMLPTCPDPDEVVRLEQRKDVQTIEGLMQKWVPHDKMPCCSLRTALYRYLDITTPPAQQFLRLLSTMTTDENDKRKIMLLATDSSRYEDWKSHLYPNILEVLKSFPSVVPTPVFMMCHLPNLQPRFYSISSAPEYKPGFIHLTVAVVQYETQTGSTHYGVCSNYLATNSVDSEVACFVRSAPNFRLPDSPFLPIIMIGPGTGIAPFRSFWQQRHLERKKRLPNEQKLFGNMTLVVGCRRPSVELYRDESQEMKREGVLSEVYTAYSRVPGERKRYVQHILREHARFVYQEVIEERGHFYVCGDVSMADDVNQTLKAIIQEGGNLTNAEADAAIKTLQEENRYHEDIFGITLKTAEVTSRGRAEAKSRRSTSST